MFATGRYCNFLSLISNFVFRECTAYVNNYLGMIVILHTKQIVIANPRHQCSEASVPPLCHLQPFFVRYGPSGQRVAETS